MSADPFPEKVDHLRQDLKAAVALREVAYARRFDDDFLRRGGKIYYAIDASILRKLFQAKPRSVAASGPRTEKGPEPPPVRAEAYQIFSGPHSSARLTKALKRSQARLREVLLWFLVDGRGAGDRMGVSNLLLLPGHTHEARNLYDDIVSDFEGQADRYGYLKETANTIREIVATPGEGRVRDRLRQDALMRTISDIVYDLEEPHKRFARINELFQRRQLLGLGAAASHPKFNNENLNVGDSHVFLTRRADDPVAGSAPPKPGTRSWWTKTLHGRLPLVFIDNDREALSTLDQLNGLLEPTKARVVLFTDNEGIIESGTGYRPFKRDGGDYAELTFSDLYLRHPKSLLVDASLMRPATEDPSAASSAIDGWLDTLLAGSLEMSGPQDAGEETERSPLGKWAAFRAIKDRLESHINEDTRLEKAVKQNPDLHSNFIGRWTTLIEGLDADYVASSPIAENELQLTLKAGGAAGSVEQVDDLLESCRTHVRRLAEQSWSTFFNTAADTGLELIDLPSIDDRSAVWTVPPLYVRGDRKLRDIVETFWDPARLRGAPSEILRRLNNPDLRESRQSSYVRTLCYGLLFAFAGRWALTKLLAERALQIANRIQIDSGADEDTGSDPSPVMVTGREANYLLTVASRITARNIADLDRAKSFIEAALSAETDLADTVDSDQSPLSGLRFQAEAVTIEVARTLMTGEADTVAHRDDTVDILRGRIVEVINNAEHCDEPRVRLQACISLRSEYFNLLLLATSSQTHRIVIGLIADQQADMDAHYKDFRLVPLRDRALLRLAAASVGALEGLAPVLQRSTLNALERPTEPHAAHRRDRRRIARIEKTVEQLNRLVGHIAIRTTGLRLDLTADDAVTDFGERPTLA